VLAGTMLALIVAAPLTAGAAPRVESAAQEPQAAPRQTDSGFDLKGSLDKLLAASDGPSGVVDSKTIAAINGPKPPKASQVVDRVLANMERWRWLPRDLRSTYVMVDVPDFTLKVVNDHRVVWRTKIVRRQVADADAAHQRDHGQRHRQSVLVRAAVDHPERAAAGLSDRPEHLRSHGP
jgi:hypothetical protein